MKRTRIRWISLLLVFMLFVSSIAPVYANTDTASEQTEATEVVVEETEEETSANSALDVEYYDAFSAESVPALMSEDGVAPAADYPDGYSIRVSSVYANDSGITLSYNGTDMYLDHISFHKVYKNGAFHWAFCIEPPVPNTPMTTGDYGDAIFLMHSSFPKKHLEK